MNTFDDTAEFQGWNVDSQLYVVLNFISTSGLSAELDKFARQVADRENQ